MNCLPNLDGKCDINQQVASTYSAFFGQVQDITFLPGGDEFISAAEVVRRNSTDKGIMVWDFRSTAILSNQIYQVCQWQARPNKLSQYRNLLRFLKTHSEALAKQSN